MADLVQVSGLSRYYGKQCAVRDVSFSLACGQVAGLLGVNGAGKTTLLQMLAGNLAPSAGRIVINGFDLLQQPIAAKRHLGYLPDTPPLYLGLTVTEFLRFCTQLQGMERLASKKAIARVLDQCGLTAVAKRLLGHLSKGYQQRVGIAQTLLHNPKVLVLDEPTVGLDPLQIREIRELIRTLGQERGIIWSTHVLTEVAALCSHVHIIHQGAFVFSDCIAHLNSRTEASALWVATAHPMNSAVLLAIPGVVAVEQLTDVRLKVHHQAALNPSLKIAETVAAAGWELLELTPVYPSIEEIFINVTGTQPL